jgi:hypothetical protein
VEVIVIGGLAIQDTQALIRVEHNPLSFTGGLDRLPSPGTRFWLEVFPANVQV